MNDWKLKTHCFPQLQSSFPPSWILKVTRMQKQTKIKCIQMACTLGLKWQKMRYTDRNRQIT